MILNTYEVQFTTTSDFYRKKMLPFNEHINRFFAENETQATERAYQKLLRDFQIAHKTFGK